MKSLAVTVSDRNGPRHLAPQAHGSGRGRGRDHDRAHDHDDCRYEGDSFFYSRYRVNPVVIDVGHHRVIGAALVVGPNILLFESDAVQNPQW